MTVPKAAITIDKHNLYYNTWKDYGAGPGSMASKKVDDDDSL
jgi:hypothetical protein